jgi:pimeloyl-ACP methyl ester carboxylesterase
MQSRKGRGVAEAGRGRAVNGSRFGRGCRVLAVGVALAAAACATSHSKVKLLPEYEQPRPAAGIKVPYPILLLPGLGQKADVWNGAAASYYSQRLRLAFGGEVRSDGPESNSVLPRGDYYTVRFSKPFDAIDNWAAEIGAAIGRVRASTGADRVILIGYSMGGLAARAYLVAHAADHHVRRLVTIGTPHLGSAFARVWTWQDRLSRCAADAGVLGRPLCSASLRALLAMQENIPFDAPALSDLRRPEDGGSYLEHLNRSGHPLDVEYVSVVGEISVIDEAKKLGKLAIAEPLRRLLSVPGDGPGELLEPGDGVVSAESQDVMNVEFFRVDPLRRRTARTVRITSVHVEHLRQTTEVQRVGLEERLELRDVTLYRRGNGAVLAVDFLDYIPPQCTVIVTSVSRGRPEQTLLPEGEPALIVTPDGIFARSLVPLREPASRPGERETLRVTVRNTFGYTAERTVEW